MSWSHRMRMLALDNLHTFWISRQPGPVSLKWLFEKWAKNICSVEICRQYSYYYCIFSVPLFSGHRRNATLHQYNMTWAWNKLLYNSRNQQNLETSNLLNMCICVCLLLVASVHRKALWVWIQSDVWERPEKDIQLPIGSRNFLMDRV